MNITLNLDRLPPLPDQFADMLLQRMRAHGITRTPEYLPDRFSFRIGHREVPLVFTFKTYLECNAAQKESLIEDFLRLVPTYRKDLPEEFDDARPDIMPGLCSRKHAESFPLNYSRKRNAFRYEVVGNHLALFPVYEWHQSIESFSDRQFRKWGKSFEEVMEVALQNLAERRKKTFERRGNLHTIGGDRGDVARIVLEQLTFLCSRVSAV